MFRSLYARLAAALLGLLLLVGVLYLVVGTYVTDLYLLEVRQKLNRDLAAHLVDEGLLLKDGDVDPDALEHVIHILMIINPSIEVYVLNQEGRILAFSAPPGEVKREQIALAPVRQFLDPAARLPVLGDDPRSPDGQKVFSAACIGNEEDPEGYVYIVLGGRLRDSVVSRLSGSYVLRMGGAAFTAVLVFTLAAGLLVFGFLTRRIRRLAEAVEAFGEDGSGSPAPNESDTHRVRGDEISRLQDTFQKMARRIGEQMERLEQADAERRELVANVSHDLRTPLTSLQGFLETLRMRGDRLEPDEIDQYLDIALRHSSKLGKRISDLFELSKLDSHDMQLQRERFSLAELAQDVVQKFQIEAGRKQIRIHTERCRDMPAVEADIALIERVVENLLSNAIRHTPQEGSITVSVDKAGRSAQLQVRDTGPGIPAEALETVFERFYRCTSDDDDDGGTGLGLAIARKIVELHGGNIRATSHPGDGAVFTVALPCG